MTQKIWRGDRQPKVLNPLDGRLKPARFLGQHTNEDANHRRAAKRRIGARQFRKIKRAMRAAQGAA